MKLALVCAGLVAFIIALDVASSAPTSHCRIGPVRGFAIVTGDVRRGGIGGLPRTFSSEQRLFAQRYNCARTFVQARRIDVGRYQIRFPGNPAKLAIASPMSGHASSLSVQAIDSDIFEVTMRGPLIENGVLLPRESSFFIVLF